MPDTYPTLVSTDELFRHLNDPAWVVFDCRFVLGNPHLGHNHYLEGHVPDALYADLNKDLSSPVTPTSGRHPLPSTKNLVARLRDWGVNNNTQVVVYDDVRGSIAGRMWWLLRYMGHPETAVLDGGFEKWRDENRPLESGETVPTGTGNFSGKPNDSMFITTEELERVFRKDDTVVIDARTPERYSDEKESVDSKGGHIPGSINHPLQTNLDANGCFRSAAELRESYAGLRRQNTIHSCGSGVTACHNLLAMEIAGLSGSRLYVGSWSEWIRSPGRPCTTGKEPG